MNPANLSACLSVCWFVCLYVRLSVTKLCNLLFNVYKQTKVYNTRSSQAVPHPSTILARWCLTSVIGRERVYSSWYGRRRKVDKCSQTQAEFKYSYRRTNITLCTFILFIRKTNRVSPNPDPHSMWISLDQGENTLLEKYGKYKFLTIYRIY